MNKLISPVIDTNKKVCHIKIKGSSEMSNKLQNKIENLVRNYNEELRKYESTYHIQNL
ncbi:MAG: hypothetical protein PUB18_05560 [bacterium]|nr:hypothetical protein [bacterium]